jgi:uncharacterized membrane protein
MNKQSSTDKTLNVREFVHDTWLAVLIAVNISILVYSTSTFGSNFGLLISFLLSGFSISFVLKYTTLKINTEDEIQKAMEAMSLHKEEEKQSPHILMTEKEEIRNQKLSLVQKPIQKYLRFSVISMILAITSIVIINVLFERMQKQQFIEQRNITETKLVNIEQETVRISLELDTLKGSLERVHELLSEIKTVITEDSTVVPANIE